jgi:hypothetical protein
MKPNRDLIMVINKLTWTAVGAVYAVSKINPDYETSLYAAFGFSDNPHLILKLHYRAYRRLWHVTNESRQP